MSFLNIYVEKNLRNVVFMPLFECILKAGHVISLKHKKANNFTIKYKKRVKSCLLLTRILLQPVCQPSSQFVPNTFLSAFAIAARAFLTEILQEPSIMFHTSLIKYDILTIIEHLTCKRAGATR